MSLLLSAGLCNCDQLTTAFDVPDEYRDLSSLPQHFNQARLLGFTNHFKNGTMRNGDDH